MGDDDHEGAGDEGVLIAMEAIHVMPEGFGCVSDSTTIEETLKRLCRDYGIPKEFPGDVEGSLREKAGVEESTLKELHYLFQVSPLTSSSTWFFYLRCSNKMGFAVPNTKGKDGD
ncbi:hypothetical protein Q3G72_013599 [Acer saccharum]|nr:hypothetical protein Q3G72_013599 [Acer saccharum]